MSDDGFIPDGFVPDEGDGFIPDEAAPAGSPLEKALKEQTGDVVTVQTPTGPAKFTRTGQRFYDSGEAGEMLDRGGSRFKEAALENALAYLGSGGKFIDEMKGAEAARSGFGDWLMGKLGGAPAPSPIQRYDQAQAETKRDVGRAVAHSPDLQVAGVNLKPVAIAGAATPSLLAPMPASWLGRVLSSGATAGIDEAGGSDARLLHGEGADFVKDVGGATGAGLAISGATEGLLSPFRALAGAASKDSKLAADAVQAQIQAAKDKAARSALSSLGGITSAQGNALETAMEVLRSPQNFSQETTDAAYRLVQSSEGKEMLSRAALNNIQRFPALFERENAARQALGAANQAASPGAVSAAAAEKLDPGNVASDVLSKGWNSIGQRAALSAAGAGAGAGISMLTGHDATSGAMFGGAGGLIAPGAMMFLRNQANNQALRSVGYGALSKALGVGANAVSAEARAVQPTVAAQARSNAYGELMKRWGVSARSDEEMADQAFLAGQSGSSP